MIDLTEHLIEEFNHAELIMVAEALGLSPTNRWGSRKLISVIRQRINKQGVPDSPNPGKSSQHDELLEDFLFVAEYIDESGNPLKKVGGVSNVTLKEFMEVHGIKQLPHCFGTADDGDPACKRCPVFRYSAEERIANLPPCYGQLYDATDPECISCLEAPFCKTNL